MILARQAFRLNGSRVLEVDLHGDAVRAAHGAMIAYTGDVSFKSAGLGGGDGLRAALERRASGGPGIRFEPLTTASAAGFVAARFSAPLYSRDWVVANGSGHLILGDRGFDINSYDLGNGNLTLRAANLLAFDASLELKQSIVPGFLTLIGTGKFLAGSSGAVIFAEPPIRVDPQALVGWADCPSPSHHYDAGWIAAAVQGAHVGRPAPRPAARGPGGRARRARPLAPADRDRAAALGPAARLGASRRDPPICCRRC